MKGDSRMTPVHPIDATRESFGNKFFKMIKFILIKMTEYLMCFNIVRGILSSWWLVWGWIIDTYLEN